MADEAQKSQNVGSRLKQGRRGKGLKPETMAKTLGITPEVLERVEAGTAELPATAVAKAAEFLGMTVEEIGGSPSARERLKKSAGEVLGFGSDPDSVSQAPKE